MKSSTSISLQTLLAQSRKGNDRARMEVYRLYHARMFGTALRFVNDRQRAEELMHDGFLEAFRKLDRFREESTFGAWLKRIVINKCLDDLRKNAPQSISWEEYGVEPAAEMAPDKWPKLSREAVSKAIESLPKASRIVVSLYLIEGFDHEEIGSILGISASTSRSQLARAKNKLKQTLNYQMDVG
ncbi:MAG: RNA polymerase sigma factor [Salibacteraceae bacterium]